MTKQSPVCGHQNMAEQNVEYLYRVGEQLMVVTDVPCLECEFCGEQYFKSVVLKRIEVDFQASSQLRCNTRLGIHGYSVIMRNKLTVDN